jgi:hypothetical protein
MKKNTANAICAWVFIIGTGVGLAMRSIYVPLLVWFGTAILHSMIYPK